MLPVPPSTESQYQSPQPRSFPQYQPRVPPVVPPSTTQYCAPVLPARPPTMRCPGPLPVPLLAPSPGLSDPPLAACSLSPTEHTQAPASIPKPAFIWACSRLGGDTMHVAVPTLLTYNYLQRPAVGRVLQQHPWVLESIPLQPCLTLPGCAPPTPMARVLSPEGAEATSPCLQPPRSAWS